MISSKNLKLAVILGAFASLGLTGCQNLHEEKETVVAFDSLPAAVKTTVNNLREDGKIGRVTAETEKGETIYETEIALADGSELELKVSAEGKLLKAKREHEKKN